ncbi:MAG: hypothetical protein A2756_05280 [Candidatus Ryanbacteria bacterium RIFCSPHIGHO2_01_FULL_48_27]|uniref:Uncharacterized protein n=1 Tax=Candidatus Ryanbacteria bacterium RIFCSPHIGHO2_01_FULL_48_27 TaxID=1802115 RepID=A0A1G2G291_9BACT|nr:MAG: hypothetical protein A2756_05280 [Candidatus Ryanbacteria bacterium RIFCSPHIGHO2_01_FULL_48_27]
MNDLTRLIEALPDFEATTIADLKRAELGVFSFEDVFDVLSSTHGLLKNLASQQDILKDDTYIPAQLVETLRERINTFNNLAKQVRGFDVTAGDPTPRRQNLITEIKNFKTSTITQLYPLVTLVQLRQLDPAKYSTGLQTMQTEVQSVLKTLKEKDEEATKTLQGIKDISASSGAEAYAHVFSTQATTHKDISQRWMWAGIVFFGILVTYLLYLLFNGVPTSEDLVHAVRDISLRVLFLVTIYFGLSQSVKNYNVNKHLQVVNEHRQNSLKTFEAFLNAATTDEVKSAVLLQATKSIFDPGKTGYLQKEGQTSYSFSVADIFKKT